MPRCQDTLKFFIWRAADVGDYYILSRAVQSTTCNKASDTKCCKLRKPYFIQCALQRDNDLWSMRARNDLIKELDSENGRRVVECVVRI